MTRCGVRPSVAAAFVLLCMLIQGAGWAQPLAELLRATPQSGAAVGREVIEYLDLTQFALDSDEWWQPLAVHPGEGRLDLAIEASPERYGFDLRGAQLLAFGEPPGRALLVRVAYDPERVHVALSARDFEATTAQTIDRYVWGEAPHVDCATNFAAGDDGDLFAGRLGKAVRLALLPGVLASSCSTAVSDDVLAAHAGATLSLFDAPSYRELGASAAQWDDAVLAADNPGRALFVRSHRELAEAALDHGDPAQALFLGPGSGASLSGIDPAAVFALSPDLSAEERSAELEALVDAERAREPLPLYLAALLADVGPGERLVLALHYTDEVSAEAALPVFAARLEAFLPDRLEGVPFAVDTHLRTFERHGEATAVVVAVVRFREANTAFRSLVAGLWQRDFAPLALP